MDERLGYRPGQHVHWIQAKLAAADPDGWQVARLPRVEPGRVLIASPGGEITRFYCLTDRLRDVLASRGLSVMEPGCLVSISRRWHVLAFPAHAGSRYLFSIADEPPGAAPEGAAATVRPVLARRDE